MRIFGLLLTLVILLQGCAATVGTRVLDRRVSVDGPVSKKTLTSNVRSTRYELTDDLQLEVVLESIEEFEFKYIQKTITIKEIEKKKSTNPWQLGSLPRDLAVPIVIAFGVWTLGIVPAIIASSAHVSCVRSDPDCYFYTKREEDIEESEIYKKASNREPLSNQKIELHSNTEKLESNTDRFGHARFDIFGLVSKRYFSTQDIPDVQDIDLRISGVPARSELLRVKISAAKIWESYINSQAAPLKFRVQSPVGVPASRSNGQPVRIPAGAILQFERAGDDRAYFTSPAIDGSIAIEQLHSKSFNWVTHVNPHPPPEPKPTHDKPPTIALLDNPPLETKATRWTLGAVVVDDQALDDVQVWLNDQAVDARAALVVGRPEAAGSTLHATEDRSTRRLEVALPLAVGENHVRVVATDNEGLTSEEAFTILRTRELGTIRAVVVGINGYRDFQPLKYARQDAEAFAAYLRKDLGVPEGNITLITEEQASLRHLRRALLTDLPGKVSKGDTVMLFWAGHGVSVPDEFSPDGDGLSKYLLVVDSERDNYEASALRMEELQRVFQRLPAERVVFFGDTCFSGAAGGRTVLAARTKGVLNEDFLARLADRQGRVILSASQANQVSLEDDKLRQGVFTHFLLKGLRGAAEDTDGDGFVSTAELLPYLEREVSRFTRNTQRPAAKGEGTVIVGKR